MFNRTSKASAKAANDRYVAVFASRAALYAYATRAASISPAHTAAAARARIERIVALRRSDNLRLGFPVDFVH